MMEENREILNYHRDLCVYVQDDILVADDVDNVVNEDNNVVIAEIHFVVGLFKYLVEFKNIPFDVIHIADRKRDIFIQKNKVMVQVNEVSIVYKKSRVNVFRSNRPIQLQLVLNFFVVQVRRLA
jgi:hypothetical protein